MEQFVLRIAEGQKNTGHAASILAMQGGPLREEAVRLGVPLFELGGTSKILRVLKAVVALRRLRPGIVHGHNDTSLHYALLAKRITGAAVVMTCHGRGKADHREPSPAEWARVDRVVCVSDAVAQDSPPAVPKERLSVIRNGIECPGASPGRDNVHRSLGIGDGFTAIIVARIDHLKGHNTLLRAWADVARTVTGATLLVVGDGVERAQMERLSADLGIGGAVRFLGFRADVGDLLGACDLFVLPSLSEGLPLSILEAMAHGLPTVATRVGGIPELITDGRHGLLVAPNDAPGLAAAILRMAQNPVLRREMADLAQQRVRDEFSFEAMLCQYDALYRTLAIHA